MRRRLWSYSLVFASVASVAAGATMLDETTAAPLGVAGAAASLSYRNLAASRG